MTKVPARSRTTTARWKNWLSQGALMVIIPPPAPDVVEAVGGMAGIALIDPGLLACGPPRNHAEVFHIVAGGRFVTLDALRRIGRRVAIAGNRPRIGAVAGGAIGAEQPEMLVPDRMAARTIERRTGRRQGVAGLHLQSRAAPVLRIEQRGVAHLDNPLIALMLDMAGTALRGLGMEHGRLLVPELGSGVA